MKTLEMLLREGTEILETAEIGEARLDAWLLLEYVTGKKQGILLCAYGSGDRRVAGKSIS